MIVFRKGEHLSRHERWTYGDVEVEVVNSYKYPGIALTTKLSTTQAIADFIPKAKRKIITILTALRNKTAHTGECSVKSLMPKYNQRFCTPLRYGVQGEWKHFKKVHLFAIKRFLRLSNRTPSVIVYGESGRYPLAVSSQIHSIKYWLRLLKLNQDRMHFGAYRFSMNLAERGEGILGWKSERAATKARLRRSVIQSGSGGRKEVS